MRTSKKNMIGVSLVEAILALVIVAGIVTMGIKLYQGFNTDVAAQRVRYNAEQIMQAAALYYYANCENMPGTTTALLDPSNYPNNSPKNPTPITVSTLVTSGYLMSAPAANPLVNSAGANGGYLIQFNQINSDRYFCDTNGCTTNQIGINANWQIQVSVLLNNTSNATRYFGMTGADCLTSLENNANTVATCGNAVSFASSCAKPHPPASCNNAGGTFNNYLSWERLPSMVSPKGQSPLWMTNIMNKQFRQFIEMPSLTYMLNNPTTTYFKCGS